MLYRTMRGAQDGRPECCATASCLGVRVDTERPDVDLEDDGTVHPRDGGLSVVPDDPGLLKPHIRPTWLGGRSTKPLWVIADDSLPPNLLYVPDSGSGPVAHGLIKPRVQMLAGDFQAALANTRPHWEEVRPSAVTPQVVP